ERNERQHNAREKAKTRVAQSVGLCRILPDPSRGATVADIHDRYRRQKRRFRRAAVPNHRLASLGFTRQCLRRAAGSSSRSCREARMSAILTPEAAMARANV